MARRRVGYARIEPAIARDLFIRHALVEGDWQTRHHFFRDNARLRAELEELEERARLEERVNQLRHLQETLDLLYEAFVRIRASDDWVKELARMQKWLAREERSRVSAAG